jgi:hypothetical protein
MSGARTHVPLPSRRGSAPWWRLGSARAFRFVCVYVAVCGGGAVENNATKAEQKQKANDCSPARARSVASRRIRPMGGSAQVLKLLSALK